MAISKKFAFTLAEVLITLTIIGVIAVLTIPNLMQSYKKHQVEVGIKEAYSILSNTLKMAQTEGDAGGISEMVANAYSQSNGDAYQAYTFFAEKYMIPYLKVSKTCLPTVSQKDCSIFTSTLIANIDGTTSNGANTHSNYKYRILLNNGMYIGVGFGQNISNYHIINFAIDINGGKGPNRYGHDIFNFSINDTYCNDTRPYYCSTENLISGCWDGTSQYSRDYAACSISDGYSCAEIIRKNGWRIPDNYPVKKW